MERKCIVVMGVSASGKSTVGAALAEKINAVFIDGDNIQPKENIAKITKGLLLSDIDRAAGLSKICTTVMEQNDEGEDCVVACGAIKRKYRDLLRAGLSHVHFVYLKGSFDLIYQRITARKNHYMSPALLQSQFSSLEEPDAKEKDVVTVAIDGSTDEIVNRIISKLHLPIPKQVE